MSAPTIEQAPGWWPSLVRVVHDECGYVGPTRDLNASMLAPMRARIERDSHECNREDD